MDNKKTIIILMGLVLTVIVATVSITYAYLSVNVVQTDPNTITTTCYNLSFTESNRINITGYPMSSASAFSKLTPYQFTLTNSCEQSSEYQIILNVVNTSSSNILPYINYSLDGTTVNKLSALTATSLPLGATSADTLSSYVIKTGSISGKDASKTYNLYMWIDESAGNDIMGSTFEAEVMVYGMAR